MTSERDNSSASKRGSRGKKGPRVQGQAGSAGAPAPRKRGRPRKEDPRKHHIPVCVNDSELRGVRIGQRSIRTTRAPEGLPDSIYGRLLMLYGRCRPVDIQRVLRDWGYGEILAAPGFKTVKAPQADPELPFEPAPEDGEPKPAAPPEAHGLTAAANPEETT